MFNAAEDNNSGAVFQVQASVNDGTSRGQHGRYGANLNFPVGAGAPGGCCGFFQPSQDLVNAFKTDPETGLPLINSYDEDPLKNDMGLASSDPYTPDTTTPVDPRLDWTVGRRGIPYLDWGKHPGAAWIRSQSYGGPYSPIKHVFHKSQKGTLSSTVGAAMSNANNYSLIRYADVLLWGAEVAVELGNPERARELVNRVRTRAKNGCYVRTGPGVADGQGETVANYKIGLYEESWGGRSKDWMRKRVRFERRLELAMEGHRFFDLVRWKIAQETLNEYVNTTPEWLTYLNGATFEERDRHFPIPLTQIENSAVNGEPTLVQNPGYR
jgi:hypothetical protein